MGLKERLRELRRHLRDPSADVRAAMAASVDRLERLGRLDSLAAALAEPDLQTRLEAIYALAELDAPEQAGPHLVTAAGSEDEDVRATATAVLGRLRYAPVVPLLIERLGDESVAVRVQAAGALGQLGAPEACDPLIAGLDDNEPEVVAAAGEALQRIACADRVPALCEKLNGADRPDRRAVIAAVLGAIGDPTAEQHLLRALSDQDAAVRRAAATALGRLRLPAEGGAAQAPPSSSTGFSG